MSQATLGAVFDEGSPQAFYLPEGSRANMEAMADATLVVDGRRLPVHSQVLSLQSGVLGGMFADLLSSGQEAAGSASGRKRKATDSEEGLVLESPFQDASLLHTALFLRFCYRPEDRTAANMANFIGSLPGLLRLAHKLDAPQIQQATCTCLAGKVHSATVPELLDWMAAADHCQQPELRLRCLNEVARRLASQPTGLASTFADSELLAERCDKSVLAQLVALLVTAGRKSVPSGLPVPSAAAAALQKAANHGSFEWALERYSQQPSAIEESVTSDWFSAAGKQWQLEVYPGGDSEEAAGHLSVYLSCKETDTRAKWSLMLVDQKAESPQHITAGSKEAADVFNSGWGTSKFIPHERLRARPGYLAGDRMLLRARVEVVP